MQFKSTNYNCFWKNENPYVQKKMFCPENQKPFLKTAKKAKIFNILLIALKKYYKILYFESFYIHEVINFPSKVKKNPAQQFIVNKNCSLIFILVCTKQHRMGKIWKSLVFRIKSKAEIKV